MGGARVNPSRGKEPVIESRAAWIRLFTALTLATLGGIGIWSYVLVLPSIEASFQVDRGAASLPYTATMLGFAVGGVIMGRLADRLGILVPLAFGIAGIAGGYVLASQATALWQLATIHGLLIGLASGSFFGPLIADTSHWFTRNRGIAVAIAASGNYLAGTIWPPILEPMIREAGWRETYFTIGVFCLLTMPVLLLGLRRPSPVAEGTATVGAGGAVSPSATDRVKRLSGLSPTTVQALLILAALSCCVAMATPQVHIVAYCGELGYGTARGAEMLSLMLGFGVASRLSFGMISDRIGAFPTLLLSSLLQMLTLAFYLPFDGLTPLYIVSALFGLSQGGIVPSYALIVREVFPASEAGSRVGTVMMASIVGMALGGWMSGLVFDWTQSYQAAFLNGVIWNGLNAAIAIFLFLRFRTPRPGAGSSGHSLTQPA